MTRPLHALPNSSYQPACRMSYLPHLPPSLRRPPPSHFPPAVVAAFSTRCFNFLLRQMQKLLAAVMKFIRSLYRLPPFMLRPAHSPCCLAPLTKFVDVDYHFQVLTFHFQFVRQAQKMLYFLCLRKVERQQALLPAPCCLFFPFPVPLLQETTVSWALLSRLSAICGILYCAQACLLLLRAVVDCGII